MTQDLSNPAEEQLLASKSSEGALPDAAGSVVTSHDGNGGAIWNEGQGDRRSTEEALFAIESRFRKLSESGMLGIAIPDRFGGFHEGNDEFLRIVGYTREDLAAGLVRWM